MVENNDLNSFLNILEKKGELLRVELPIDPYLEIGTLTHEISKKKGPALLFEQVKGHSMKVLTNAFGSMDRMALALNCNDLESQGERVLGFLSHFKAIPSTGSQAAPLESDPINNFLPILENCAPCQEIVWTDQEIDLNRLPVLTLWPGDAAPAITLPLVFTTHPVTTSRNVGIYRMQVLDPRTTAIHWSANSGGANHYDIAQRRKQPLEVAVALGPEPALTYAASAPLPRDVDEVIFAGFLLKRPIKMVKCLTVDMLVPSSSQIVLEGILYPGETCLEGPFGNFTGYYSLPEPCPVFHITCITMRREAIYPATMVGPPPQEDCYMAKATERLFLPIIKKTFPEIVDLNLPLEGIFHNVAFVSIKKRYPGHAKRLIMNLWKSDFLKLFKIIFVFDNHVDIQDIGEVLWRIGTNLNPDRDLIISTGPLSRLDPASANTGHGAKLGIDCTQKWPGEGTSRPWPRPMEFKKETIEKMERLLQKLYQKGTRT